MPSPINSKKRVLVIKLTSMGDLMHALPALTDARSIWPGMEFDWVVDEAFAEVPSWHPGVKRIFRSAHRRWRQQFWSSLAGGEFLRFYRDINHADYDVIIDAQNNLKSAVISWLRRGHVHGLDKHSAAEMPAHLVYRHEHAVDKSLHAIARQRLLFAESLGYEIPDSPPDYGIRPQAFTLPSLNLPERYLLMVHNASWTTKLWPEAHWHELIERAAAQGYAVLLPGGSEEELTRAGRLAEEHDNAMALPRLSLSEIGGLIRQAAGAVCCDTGLAHLTAMIGTPAVCFYGPTSDALIGTTGRNQHHLVAGNPPFACAPCYKRKCRFNKPASAMSACMNAFSAGEVWRTLDTVMRQKVEKVRSGPCAGVRS